MIINHSDYCSCSFEDPELFSLKPKQVCVVETSYTMLSQRDPIRSAYAFDHMIFNHVYIGSTETHLYKKIFC